MFQFLPFIKKKTDFVLPGNSNSFNSFVCPYKLLLHLNGRIVFVSDPHEDYAHIHIPIAHWAGDPSLLVARSNRACEEGHDCTRLDAHVYPWKVVMYLWIAILDSLRHNWIHRLT